MGTRLVAAVVAIQLIGPSASAEENLDSGNSYLEACTADKGSFNMGTCLGFIHGILQSQQRDERYFCAPNGITIGQARAIIIKYLNDNPDRRHYQFAALANMALARVFPCPLKKP
jgi:hypothetical protein